MYHWEYNPSFGIWCLYYDNDFVSSFYESEFRGLSDERLRTIRDQLDSFYDCHPEVLDEWLKQD